MGLIGRYIFRRAAGAFIAALAVLASVVWVTQALRQLDLITAKGQAIGVFLEITLLAVPFLVLLIAPFAIVIAVVVVLSNLSADSELIAMHAAGTSRWLVLKPILVLGIAVGLFAAFLSMWAAPLGLQFVRLALNDVQVDVVASIIKPGRFIEMEPGLTFHIRDRTGGGVIKGLVLSDERDPDKAMTYIAKDGEIVGALNRTLLVMKDGTIQRRTADGALSIVRFDTYAFDLSSMTPVAAAPVFRPSERSTFDLATSTAGKDEDSENFGRLRSELNDRLSQPLYPLAFALVVFVFLGEPRTTRQGRSFAVLGAIVVVGLVRLAGFGATTLAIRSPVGVFFMYGVPLGTSALALALLLSDAQLQLPAPIARGCDRIAATFGRIAERLVGSPREA